MVGVGLKFQWVWLIAGLTFVTILLEYKPDLARWILIGVVITVLITSINVIDIKGSV